MSEIKFNYTPIDFYDFGDARWADGAHVLAALYGGSHEEKHMEWAVRMLPENAIRYVQLEDKGGVYSRRAIFSLWGVMILAIKSTATLAAKFQPFWMEVMETELADLGRNRAIMRELRGVSDRIGRLENQAGVPNPPQGTHPQPSQDIPKRGFFNRALNVKRA